MDTTQLLLTTTLAVTTIFLIVVGVQLFFVLRELQKTIHRVNSIVDGFEKVGGAVQHGFTEVFGFLAGIKTFFKAADAVSKKRHERRKT